MYPTLVIRPGESIDVRVDGDISLWGYAWRRVVVDASPGDAVELEILPDDISKPMALSLVENIDALAFPEFDMSVRRLMVPPAQDRRVPYVLADFRGAGTATLTARR
jgi:hypothetical protein